MPNYNKKNNNNNNNKLLQVDPFNKYKIGYDSSRVIVNGVVITFNSGQYTRTQKLFRLCDSKKQNIFIKEKNRYQIKKEKP